MLPPVRHAIGVVVGIGVHEHHVYAGCIVGHINGGGAGATRFPVVDFGVAIGIEECFEPIVGQVRDICD